MLQINCPWCGVRDEDEFSCGGQSHIIRAPNPATISDQQWSAYLFDRVNPKGISLERWRHTYGCRQWFNLARDTVSHQIVAVYQMTDPVPEALRDNPISVAAQKAKEALL